MVNYEKKTRNIQKKINEQITSIWGYRWGLETHRPTDHGLDES